MNESKRFEGSTKAELKLNVDRKGEVGQKPRYSSKIIKAGALLPDTKALLSVLDLDLSMKENLNLIRLQNLLGKASRSRAKSILSIFQQRYLAEENVARALATLVRRKTNEIMLDRILYFHAARADLLIQDIVIKLLVKMRDIGIVDIGVYDIEKTLKKWAEEGRTSGNWGDNTIHRVAQGLLSTLRDFGVLHGAIKKRIAPVYLPVQAFSYIAFYLRQHHPSGTKLNELCDWRLFFLSQGDVERFFLEAHQHGLLEYHVAGSVTRLTFTVETLEEYANVITQ